MLIPWVAVPLLWLATASVPLAVTDVRSGRLPDSLVLPGLVLTGWALAGAAFGGQTADVVHGLAGAALTGAVLGASWAVGTMGMGDVKLGLWLGGLAGAIGVAQHPFAVAQGLALGSVLAGLQVVVSLRGGGALSTARVPLGPPLLAAFWASAGGLVTP